MRAILVFLLGVAVFNPYSFAEPVNPCALPEICVEQPPSFVAKYRWISHWRTADTSVQEKVKYKHWVSAPGTGTGTRSTYDSTKLEYPVKIEERAFIDSSEGQSVLVVSRKGHLVSYPSNLGGKQESVAVKPASVELRFRLGHDLIPRRLNGGTTMGEVLGTVSEVREESYPFTSRGFSSRIDEADARKIVEPFIRNYLDLHERVPVTFWSNVEHTRLYLTTQDGNVILKVDREMGNTKIVDVNEQITDSVFEEMATVGRIFEIICPKEKGAAKPLMRRELFQATYQEIRDAAERIVQLESDPEVAKSDINLNVRQEFQILYFLAMNVVKPEIDQDEQLAEVGPLVKKVMDRVNRVNQKVYQFRPTDQPGTQLLTRMAKGLRHVLSTILTSTGAIPKEVPAGNEGESSALLVGVAPKITINNSDKSVPEVAMDANASAKLRVALMDMKRSVVELESHEGGGDADAAALDEVDKILDTYKEKVMPMGFEAEQLGASRAQLQGMHTILKTIAHLRGDNLEGGK